MIYPLGIKTDYNLLDSLIKIPDLITFLKEKKVNACGILDDNLCSSIEFYNACISNNIKPIIGYKIQIDFLNIYLYAKNYNGFKELLNIDYNLENIKVKDLNNYHNIIIVLPYESISLNKTLTNTYYSYRTKTQLNELNKISDKIVYIDEAYALYEVDLPYLNYLSQIKEESNILNKSFIRLINNSDSFINEINIEFPKGKIYIPHFDNDIEDSFNYLYTLAKKGLAKRLNNKVTKPYTDRLMYELEVIKKMGFVDYFLIVYDYVKYAKKNNILVGPGRGSAAGSLVAFSTGITEIDPIKYDLLFERFLNKERITMPDIDIDFEDNKRYLVKDYIINRYGASSAKNIMTYSTLGSRQVIKDVGKILNINEKLIDKICKIIDSKSLLIDSISNPKIKSLTIDNPELNELFDISLKLEGLKRQISTHAAGIVVSSIELNSIVPIVKSGDEELVGYQYIYLEDLGLIKMDILGIKNLSIISSVLEYIRKNEKKELNLNEIPLNDSSVYNLFRNIMTTGIFQFESNGMKNFMSKFKPTNFNDLTSMVALFRPGPMQNIDSYIKRKNKQEKIDYITPSLEPILSSTYGIIVYQEQIMQILNVMGSYSYAEADLIRRAMSKKKKGIIESEQNKFITRAKANGYSEEISKKVYDYILKFANYGFNKAHSVSYALIGYQMAYLKVHYPLYFIINLLNLSIGSEIKTKEYLDEAKLHNIVVNKPDINISTNEYIIHNNEIYMPLTTIKNLGSNASTSILEERKKGSFTDYFNFIIRTYSKVINHKVIESLIDADTFRNYNYNHKTLYQNIDSGITYAELISGLDNSLLNPPEIIKVDEFDDLILMEKEKNIFGFHISNHPTSKYNTGFKLINIESFFDKTVSVFVIINSVKKIKTKNNETMAFIHGEDETRTCEFTIFPKNINVIDNIENGNLVKITGNVQRRYDKYQIVVYKIEKI